MDQQTVLTQLQGFVSKDILEDGGAKLDAETPLLAWGILDSLAMVKVLSYLEAEMGVEVPDDEVRPEHFETLTTLSALVVRLKAAGGVH